MSKNWQGLLDLLTTKANTDGILSKIKACTCSDDVIELCYNSSEGFYRNGILSWMKESIGRQDVKKSVSQAEKFRQLGNKKFIGCDNVGSLNMYTACLCCAPESSTELSLALGNRSAVLFHLEKYEECLRDIDIALQKGFPLPLKYKLYIRQSKCFKKLGQLEKEIEALRLVEDYLKYIDAPNNKISSLQSDNHKAIADALQQLDLTQHPGSAVGTSTSSLIDTESSYHLSPTYGENSNFAFASAALTLQYDTGRGRHVVANRNISMGDLIFVEEPYACVVLPDQEMNHCHHCCASLCAPIPCWKCTGVLYCREECRRASWETYHQWECRGLQLLHAIGIAHLGLRVVLQAGSITKLLELSKSPLLHDKLGVTSYGCKDDNYPFVYRLSPHMQDMEGEDLFQYALTALLLALYLRTYTNYFRQTGDLTHCDIESDSLSDTNIVVAGLILRHICQLVCNGHAITKLDKPELQNTVVAETQVRIGTAIYPSASMMNHSCEPNIINSFHDQRLIVRASQDIPKGNEVFNCYGPHFRRMPFEERQEILQKQYFFTCTCGPCSQPKDRTFQERFSAFQCLSCGGPLVSSSRPGDALHVECGDCGQTGTVLVHKADSQKACQHFENGCCQLESNNVAAALKQFQACLELRKTCLYKSNRDLTSCMDQLAKCCAMMGNYEKSIEYLQQCLPAVKEQFGTNSIEVANELQKLTDVMMCDLQQQPPGPARFRKYKLLAEYVNDAYQIMDICCGRWTTGFQEIMAKKLELQQMTMNE